MLNSVGLASAAFHKAVETGALEKFRTGQPLDNEEIKLISGALEDIGLSMDTTVDQGWMTWDTWRKSAMQLQWSGPTRSGRHLQLQG
jgi:hypothetical protein